MSSVSKSPRLLVGLDQLEERSVPATLTVTNLDDSGPGSLRDAVSQANDEINHPGPDIIAFVPAVQHGTINLTTFTNLGASTSAVPQPAGPTGLIVTSSITLAGTGETLTRSGASFRLFQVTGAGNLTLMNLTLSNGLAQGGAGGGGGGGAAGLGGAIYNQGSLTIQGCTLTANQAIGGATDGGGAGGGGGLGGPGGSGGYTEGGGSGGGPNGGAAFGGGGGIPGQPEGGPGGFGGGGGLGYNGGMGGFGGGGGVGNNVGGGSIFGGGNGGNLRPAGTPGASLAEGGSGLGGAIFNQGGTVVVGNATITGNTARGGDAPMSAPGQSGGAFGGGVFNLNGSLSLTNVTIAGNSVAAGATAFSEQAVGVADGGELVSACYNLATGTQFVTVTMGNCIISHPGNGSAVGLFRNSGSTSLDASGPNLVFGSVNNFGGLVSGIPFIVSDPRLGPLTTNGGFTQTMKPQSGSLAIDAGSTTAANGQTHDQRGVNFLRVFNGAVDLGAVEVQPTPPVPDSAVSGQLDGSALALSPSGGQFVVGKTLPAASGAGVNARTAVADVNGDGVPDYILGAGPGAAPRVTVIDGKTGATLVSFLAFEDTFTGGVFVAAGDIDGDGKAEVVVTPDESGGPVVAVYSGAKLAAGIGGPDAQITRFFGIAGDPNFRGGCRPALGDLNGDGAADLIVSAGVQGGPRIAVFDGRSLAAGSGDPARLVGDFFAFEDTLRNGAFVAAGDVNGDGRADIAFGGGPGGAPRVRLFDGAKLLASPPAGSVDGIAGTAQLANFFAGDASLRGGVRLALHDSDADGRADLLTGSGAGEPSRVRVYKSANLLTNASPSTDQELDPFGGTVLANGVFVG